MRKYDMNSLLMARLAIQERSTIVINVTRSHRQERFDARDIEIANKFHPHLVRAVRLADRFSEFRGLNCGLSEMAERSHHAVFLVTATGKICYMNRAAKSLLDNNKGIASKRGILVALTPDLTRKLHGLVATAGARREERRSGWMAIARPHHRFPLSAIISPVGPEHAPTFHDGPSVLVSISDPEAAVALPEQKLRDTLGLTRAEARIATKLLDGLDTRKTAEALGVSFHTVRAHLSRIFEKTGTDGQAALVGLLTRVASQPRE
jgi:DNA-binding CsgD family transcriptional regulator